MGVGEWEVIIGSSDGGRDAGSRDFRIFLSRCLILAIRFFYHLSCAECKEILNSAWKEDLKCGQEIEAAYDRTEVLNRIKS